MKNDSDASKNIVWHESAIKKEDRHKLNGHRSIMIWFTGLSGAGKSTIANALQHKLFNKNINVYLLDGDNLRHGINNNLSFAANDRKENIRRAGEVGKLFVDAGFVILAALISPFEEDRMIVRSMFEEDEFIEVYVKCSLEECEKRDPKGLYKKARSGEIKQFTGIDQTYEEPKNPEVIINTDTQSIEESVEALMNYLLGQANLITNKKE